MSIHEWVGQCTGRWEMRRLRRFARAEERCVSLTRWSEVGYRSEIVGLHDNDVAAELQSLARLQNDRFVGAGSDLSPANEHAIDAQIRQGGDPVDHTDGTMATR